MARAWRRWACVALVAMAVSGASGVAAQKLGDPTDSGASLELSGESGAKATQRKGVPGKDVAAAESEIEAGVASLQAGKLDNAVQRFTAVLSGGSLPGPLIARALYHRGVAYRRSGKPVQAISDLTSALWLKNGLDANYRGEALAMRAAAYRDAGLPDQVDADVKKLAASAAGGPANGATDARSEMETEASSTESPEGRWAAPASRGGFGGLFSSLFGTSSAVQTGAVPGSSPPTASAGWLEGTKVRKGD
jgi:hypothetical protein